jgi:hypothetical protein
MKVLPSRYCNRLLSSVRAPSNRYPRCRLLQGQPVDATHVQTELIDPLSRRGKEASSPKDRVAQLGMTFWQRQAMIRRVGVHRAAREVAWDQLDRQARPLPPPLPATLPDTRCFAIATSLPATLRGGVAQDALSALTPVG